MNQNGGPGRFYLFTCSAVLSRKQQTNKNGGGGGGKIQINLVITKGR